MVIALCGQKGGSGKSTVALAIAAELQSRGKRVLLVDADPQGTARTWGDVAAEAGHAAPTVVAMGAKMHLPGQLDAVGRAYDVIVIDCPPRHSDVQRSALMVADLAVLPCRPSPADAWAMTETVEMVTEAMTLRPALQAFGLITQQRRAAIGETAREALAQLGIPVLKVELGLRAVHSEAMAVGIGVTKHDPDSLAAQEVRALVDEVLHHVGRSNGKAKTRTGAAKTPTPAGRSTGD